MPSLGEEPCHRGRDSNKKVANPIYFKILHGQRKPSLGGLHSYSTSVTKFSLLFSLINISADKF